MGGGTFGAQKNERLAYGSINRTKDIIWKFECGVLLSVKNIGKKKKKCKSKNWLGSMKS